MVLRNVIEVNEKKPLFQLFFLKDDEDRSVEVKEVEEVDFREVERRLKQGESVFITCKREQELKTKMQQNPWYFSHI